MTDDLRSNSDQVDNLLQGLQQRDPRLYDLLKLINKDLQRVFTELHPIKRIVDTQREALSTPPSGVGSFSYVLNLYNITLSWTAFDATAIQYEIRQGVAEGTPWDSATFLLRTPSLSALINPLPTGLSYFIIRSINSAGVYSDPAQQNTPEVRLTVIVPEIQPSSIISQTIDNNILLTWAPFTSVFAIDHYNVYKGETLVGSLGGSFFAIFEFLAGTYIYSVEAVDIAGNVSPKSSVNATVTQPPDFALLLSITPDLSAATLTNAYWDAPTQKLLVPVDLADTWESHFTDEGWTTPQDQITAGFDIYIQPDTLTGQLITQEIDLGAELANVIINLSWSADSFLNTDSTNITPAIDGAPTSHTYIGYQAGQSAFFQAVRYLKIKFDFSGTTDSLIAFHNLRVAVDVKRELDSNSIDCLASDTTGTIVYIDGAHDPLVGHGRKVFRDVDSITLTPAVSSQPIMCLFDFVDDPNPTEFKILCFDTAGARVDAFVSWKVRGII